MASLNQSGVVIAPATVAERDWCAHRMAGSEPWITLGRGYEQCRALCHHPEYTLLVAHAGGVPCGFLLLHPRGVAGSPYIASVAVADEFRGRGVGTLLMARVETEWARTAAHIFLCVSSFNPAARRLYERLGYEAVGELKDYVIAGASEILMHKRLTRP